MLLLYLMRVQDQTDRKRHIYIPLCFYFIHWRIRESTCESHLHSTMLLLYPKLRVFVVHPIIIYIPLCFYFILYTHISWRSPRIFTFHYASTLSTQSTRTPRRLIGFTFHYASTLSLVASTWRLASSAFTFHYASTLSNQRYTHCMSFLHLHSTMLLLYPWSQPPRLPGKGFTFHYASTLSPT